MITLISKNKISYFTTDDLIEKEFIKVDSDPLYCGLIIDDYSNKLLISKSNSIFYEEKKLSNYEKIIVDGIIIWEKKTV